MNKKKTVSVSITLLILLFSVFGTAAAHANDRHLSQSIAAITPTVEPSSTVTPVVNRANPIVTLFEAFFGPIFDNATPKAAPTPVPGGTPVVTDTPVPGGIPTAVPTPAPSGATKTVGEQVAGDHADGMGFGVLVKLYSMAAASKAACASSSSTAATTSGNTPCVPVTVEELIAQFKSGTGMGGLMKTYGRPDQMGVGQVRKALKAEQNPGAPNNPAQNQPDKGNGKNKGKKK